MGSEQTMCARLETGCHRLINRASCALSPLPALQCKKREDVQVKENFIGDLEKRKRFNLLWPSKIKSSNPSIHYKPEQRAQLPLKDIIMHSNLPRAPDLIARAL